MKSIYFDKYADEPTGLSKGKLETLKTMIDNESFQIIEINSFSNIEGGLKKNQILSSNRVNFILNLLDVDRSAITINTFGNERVKVNFSPKSWNRVDVYYNVPEEPTIDQTPQIRTIEHNSIVEPDELKIVEGPIEESKRVIPDFKDIVEDIPIIMPIKFEGGTNEIIQTDKEYLDHLYSTLQKHTSLKAHIRGHVCCGNNKRISKKRAKIIYDYLIEKGISKNRLSFKGYSNSDPIVYPERTSEDRKTNRRVDIVFKK